MTVAQLVAVRDAAAAIADQPGVQVFDDFIIFHGPCREAIRKYRVRAFFSTVRIRVADWVPVIG